MAQKSTEEILEQLIDKLYAPSEEDKKEFWDAIQKLNDEQKKQLTVLFYKRLEKKQEIAEEINNAKNLCLKRLKEIKEEEDADKILEKLSEET